MHLIFGPTVGQRENIKSWDVFCPQCWEIDHGPALLTGRSLYLPSLVKTVVASTSCSEHCQGRFLFVATNACYAAVILKLVGLLDTWSSPIFFRTLKIKPHFPVQYSRLRFEKKRLSAIRKCWFQVHRFRT